MTTIGKLTLATGIAALAAFLTWLSPEGVAAGLLIGALALVTFGAMYWLARIFMTGDLLSYLLVGDTLGKVIGFCFEAIFELLKGILGGGSE